MRLTANVIGFLGTVTLVTSTLAAGNDSFLGQLHNIRTVGSTVPGNGDVNPYGVAVVPETTGTLVAKHVLVSNFNNSSNLQGTGTTIVQMGPDGKPEVFASLAAGSLGGPCPGGVGLTTALAVTRSGWVIVGSLPTSDGTSATIQQGCLIVINRSGKAVMTLEGTNINGPWDMTALDLGGVAVLFVSNVLDGSVVRLVLTTPFDDTMPRELAPRVKVATGIPERPDPAALIIGPTGLGLGFDGTLYVADTLGNRIAAVPNALFRMDSPTTLPTVSQGKALNGPLGLAIAANGDILTVNAGDGNMVETTPAGNQVAVKAVDVSNQGGGTLFGLAIAPDGPGVYFVDDGNNTLNILR